MKTESFNTERLVAALALMLLLVTTLIYTRDTSDWFLLGLNLIEATTVNSVSAEPGQVTDVSHTAMAPGQWLGQCLSALTKLK
ncbi:hypothetical protein [Shewanella algae]|uniref:hypothetical protein n=1 Tax=Shewanella algae TaxID=38313 RepID=UPI0006D16EEF|nr:hypothetical protein [Shewanella algae]PSS72235.1 hypothetical protein AYI88_14240 [Shewanella algae]BCV59589.1 hypothetical protein TUM17384_35340 [Shewanella algae]